MFKVCMCPNERYIKDIDYANKDIKSLERCCPKTKLVEISGSEKKLRCILDKKGQEPEKHCEGKFIKTTHFHYNSSESQLTWQQYENAPTNNSISGYDFCVGLHFNRRAETPEDHIKMNLLRSL